MSRRDHVGIRIRRRGLGRGGRAGLLALSLAALALAIAPGCRDEIAPPTEGRIRVTIEGAADVDVYVDGALVATDPGEPLGPFPAGLHVVSVVRECFETLPGRDLEVEVRPGTIARTDFRLEAREFGSVEVRAYDELSGQEVAGAEIYREIQPQQFQSTGLATPATLEGLPCGPVRLLVRRAPEYADSDPLEVRVDTGAKSQADFTMGPPSAALAEMFTYVICPNCPDAAKELARIEAARPREIYLIEWHTWSSLPLYTPEGEAREAYYLGTATPGWPVVVFQGDGANYLLGSQSGTLAEYSNRVDAVRQACSNDCPVILTTETVTGGGRSDVTARAKLRSGAVPGAVMLRWVAVEDSVVTSGNQPYFDGVPRAVHEEPVTLPVGEVVVWTWGIDLDPSWNETHLRWVVLLQSDATHEVLAVHGSH